MKKHLTLASASLLAVCLLATAAPQPVESASARLGPERYSVDLVHSTIMFRVKHIDVSYAYGRFNEFSGEIHWAPEHLDDTSVAFEVKASSVDTNHEGRDDHLRGPDFFSCKEFPTWSFESKEVEGLGDGRYAVTGELSMRGQEKELRIEMEKTGEGEQRGTKKIGFETTFTIQRSDFGMNYAMGGVGDDVRVTISIEANEAKD